VARLLRHRLFWPIVALVALLAVNVAFTPSFFSIRVRDGHLYGSIIDILINGSPLLLLALGMTLVIATGGIDLSVGSVMAISGGLACSYIADLPDQNSVGGVLVAIGIALVAALLLGTWNGFLVAKVGLQPIVATLILMVTGRGIAQLITSGQIVTVRSDPYKLLSGYWLSLPFSILIVAVVIGLTALVTRRSALGTLLEAVGGNAEASRLVGIRSRQLKIMAYAFCGLCAGIAGLINSSNIAGADGNSAGLWTELDAIMAVVIGGTALTGGRFTFSGTVIGALIIQTLTTTIFTIGVPAKATMMFKAIVVICVFLLQSPRFQALRFRRAVITPAAPAPDLEAVR